MGNNFTGISRLDLCLVHFYVQLAELCALDCTVKLENLRVYGKGRGKSLAAFHKLD
jgi:hypothetical protein